jgi:hypothetical protein
LKPSRAIHRHNTAPLGLCWPRPDGRIFVEHLAGVNSLPPLQADRPPPRVPSRQRSSIACIDRLAQHQLILLSYFPWPHSPRSAARQRLPRPGSSPGHPWIRTPPEPPVGTKTPTPISTTSLRLPEEQRREPCLFLSPPRKKTKPSCARRPSDHRHSSGCGPSPLSLSAPLFFSSKTSNPAPILVQERSWDPTSSRSSAAPRATAASVPSPGLYSARPRRAHAV